MSDDGYVHRSGEAVEEAAEEGNEGREARNEGSDTAADGTGGDPTFDWRGWVLVATVVFAFIVVPTALLYLPSVQGLVERVGLSLRDAYLVLPLLPAFLLGTVAVWSAVRSR